MGLLFGGFGVVTMLIYLFLVVLGGMFLYRGFIFFGRKVETDQALLQKLDQLIEKLDNVNHGDNKMD